jgi:hypothetical protein
VIRTAPAPSNVTVEVMLGLARIVVLPVMGSNSPFRSGLLSFFDVNLAHWRSGINQRQSESRIRQASSPCSDSSAAGHQTASDGRPIGRFFRYRLHGGTERTEKGSALNGRSLDVIWCPLRDPNTGSLSTSNDRFDEGQKIDEYRLKWSIAVR